MTVNYLWAFVFQRIFQFFQFHSIFTCTISGKLVLCHKKFAALKMNDVFFTIFRWRNIDHKSWINSPVVFRKCFHPPLHHKNRKWKILSQNWFVLLIEFSHSKDFGKSPERIENYDSTCSYNCIFNWIAVLLLALFSGIEIGCCFRRVHSLFQMLTLNNR